MWNKRGQGDKYQMTELNDIYAFFMLNKTNSLLFFLRKGFTKKTIEKYGLFEVKIHKNDSRLLELLDKDYLSIIDCYSYVIPGLNEKGELDYLMLRKTLDCKKNKADGVHKHLYLGEIDRGVGKIYNSIHLCDTTKLVFIVESWTDALSFEEIGYPSIALNRVVNCHKVLEPLITKYAEMMGFKTFIVMCDSDEIGQSANTDIFNMLKTHNIHSYLFNDYPQGVKDPNEWLQYNRDNFKETINKYLKEL